MSTRVGHGQGHPFQRLAIAQHHVFALHAEGSAFRYRVAGVGCHVDERHLDLQWIDPDRPELVG